MRKTFIYALLAMGATAVTPVMAQGVYVGPNGIGVDTGLRPHYRDYDRDRTYDNRDRRYEGRSVYRNDGYRHRDFDDE